MIERAARRFGMTFWQACNSACTWEIPHGDRLSIDWELASFADLGELCAKPDSEKNVSRKGRQESQRRKVG